MSGNPSPPARQEREAVAANDPHDHTATASPSAGEGGIFSLSTLAYGSSPRVVLLGEVLRWVGVICTAPPRPLPGRALEEGGSNGTDRTVSWAAQAWAVEQHPGSGVRKAVLLALAYCANHETNLCFPKIETLCSMTDFRPTAVKDALAGLEAEGYIGRERERREDGTLGVNHYSFPALGPRDDSGGLGHQGRETAVAPGPRDGPQEPEEDLEPNHLPSEASQLQVELFVVDNASEGPPSINGGSNGAVSEVYAHWRSERGKTRSNYDAMSPKRKAVIEARLKEFTVDDLRHAIDGVGCDPWPDRKLHDDLLIIFRNHEQVDKFLELWRNRRKERAPADDLIARNMGKARLRRGRRSDQPRAG